MSGVPGEMNQDLFNPYKKVNRLIVIGNGFDLAHGMKSSFKDFIFDYCFEVIKHLIQFRLYEDRLLSYSSEKSFSDGPDTILNLTPERAFESFFGLSERKSISFRWHSQFFSSIMKEVERKNWVDIELVYFDLLKEKVKNDDFEGVERLNDDLHYLKQKLISYLNKELQKAPFQKHPNFSKSFFEPIRAREVKPLTVETDQEVHKTCVLNFNYTAIVKHYFNANFEYIPIHGQLDGDDLNKQAPVFGFGDELDRDYLEFEHRRNNSVFQHIKSFKYLQFSQYRNLLAFIESAPYQIQIYGHSCGLSDRTLLNTIFEHENCISIKPYYYSWNGVDDFDQKVIAISRHFKSKAELRARVVDRSLCEPMPQLEFI